MDEDYYHVLGVSRNANEKEIQKAYRDAARKNHPDLNPDDASAQARFQKVQQAYEVLSDPEKRKLYDRYGSRYEQAAAAHAAGAGGGGNPFASGGVHFEDVDLGDIFGQMFGNRGGGNGPRGGFDPFRGGRAPAKGREVHREVLIPFTTAIEGGKFPVDASVDVVIPAGIEDGKKLRLPGRGEPGPGGGPAGDLVVTVHVGKHPTFRRRGNDLEFDLPVSLREAVLGCKVEAPTPKGTLVLTVPPMSSSGKRLRVRGYGVQPQGKPAGDLFAVLQIVLDEEDAEHLREFVERTPADESLEVGDDLRSGLRW